MQNPFAHTALRTAANLAANAGSTLVSDPGLGLAVTGGLIAGAATAPVSVPAAIGTALGAILSRPVYAGLDVEPAW